MSASGTAALDEQRLVDAAEALDRRAHVAGVGLATFAPVGRLAGGAELGHELIALLDASLLEHPLDEVDEIGQRTPRIVSEIVLERGELAFPHVPVEPRLLHRHARLLRAGRRFQTMRPGV